MTSCKMCACENFLPADRKDVPADCAYFVDGAGLCTHCLHQAGYEKFLYGMNRHDRRAYLSNMQKEQGKTLQLIDSLEDTLNEEQDIRARLRLKVEINTLYMTVKRPRKYDTARN